ncbi:MAG: ABC transporter permease, partial [Micrococcales bacterium]|nr:ABC transporter permease [Micrococcales bacterium]
MSRLAKPEVSFQRGRLSMNGRDVTMVAVLGVVLVVLAIGAIPLTDGVFYTKDNLLNIMKQWPSQGYGFLAIGMLFVILTGGIDLSVGAVLCFSGVTAGLLSLQGLPVWVAMLAGIATGVAWGAFNGFLVARFDLAPFVVTLATMTMIRGWCQVLSAVAVRPSDPSFSKVTNFRLFGIFPSGVLALFVFLVAATVFLNRTPLGRSTIAIGGNRETVRLAGISVNRGLITAYMISG